LSVFTEKDEKVLLEHIVKLRHDPLGFVMFSFPWGQENTELANEDGPDDWQREFLIELGKASEEGDISGEVAQLCTASGHGVGKTALISWIILWFMSTRNAPIIKVTANTKNQLETTTWRELGKWHEIMVHKHWFHHTATRFYYVHNPKRWYAAAIPWSVTRKQAFAGTHDQSVLMIFDEASEVEDVIWETAFGALTTDGSMMIAFGNPTQNTGMFAEVLEGEFAHRWHQFRVDSRNAKKANQKKIQEWIDDYGEDSDFVRIRVKGMLPRTGSSQLISLDSILDAINNTVVEDVYGAMPVVLGVDVARFGDDQTVLVVRQGRKLHEIEKHRELDNVQVTEKVVRLIHYWQPRAVFVDGVGLGAGVVDILKHGTWGHIIIDVNMGRSPEDKKLYFNKRAEAWVKVKNWLNSGADIPKDDDLKKDLQSIEYKHTVNDALQLESKTDLKARIGYSPDCGDSLALTFAMDIHEEAYDDDYEDSVMMMGESTGMTGY